MIHTPSQMGGATGPRAIRDLEAVVWSRIAVSLGNGRGRGRGRFGVLINVLQHAARNWIGDASDGGLEVIGR